jgi:glycosyltransferase involved in cell wall biosynthesis
MAGNLKASVIIPTYNRRAVLTKVLSCYEGQTARPGDFEIVVVNDGGDDDTSSVFKRLSDLEAGFLSKKRREIVTEAGLGSLSDVVAGRPTANGGSAVVCYLKIVKSGRAAARNIGIMVSKNPLVIFADDDIFVEPEFVRKHIEAHHPGDRLVVRGRVIHTKSLEDPFSAKWKPKDINTSFLATGNASVLKEQLLRAGCFDERYTVYGWEDFDLGIHLSENGLKSVRRKIKGYHYDPKKKTMRPSEIYSKEKERGSSAVYFYSSHPLPYVRRFTLVENSMLRMLFRVLGRNNWFLKKDTISRFKGFLRLVVRYKGYFDGVAEAESAENVSADTYGG